MLAVILAALVIIALTVPITPEARSWDHAKTSFTIGSLENYLNSYPDGAHAEKARSNIENLKQVKNLTLIKYEGRYYGNVANEVSLINDAGEIMSLHYSDDVAIINKAGKRKWLSDLETYDALEGYYVVLPDGAFLAQSAQLEERWGKASCGC